MSLTVRLVCMLVVACSWLTAADADSRIRELVLQLSDRAACEQAVADLVAMGDARVETVFRQARERKLVMVDDVVVIEGASKDVDGAKVVEIFDLLAAADETGTPIGEPLRVVDASAVGSFRIQRKGRKALINALDVIGLYLEDPAMRLRAAKAVGDKRVVTALEQLQVLAASDPDPAVQLMAKESAALITLANAPVSDVSAAVLDAVRTLGAVESIRGKDLVSTRLADENLPDAARAVHQEAMDAIEWHVFVTDWTKHLFSGLSLGSILLMTSLGLAVSFGLMGVINMAHGEMLMLGAITTWFCSEYLYPQLPPEWANWWFVAALPAAFLVTFLVGVVMEVSVVKWLYSRPLDSLLATIGVSFVMIWFVREQWQIGTAMKVLLFVSAAALVVRWLWFKRTTVPVIEALIVFYGCWAGLAGLLALAGSGGGGPVLGLGLGDNLAVQSVSWFSGGWEIAKDVVLPYNRLFIIALTLVSLLSVFVLFRFTRFGLMLRATVQNRSIAAANGVNTRMVDMVTFGLASGIAGIAGCALVLMTNPTPQMGQGYIVKSFLVVVVGGVGSLMGVVYSALSLGFLEKIIEPIVLFEEPIRIFDSTWAQVAVLLIVVLFITKRPGGLFPEKGRMADQADGTAGTFIPRLNGRHDLVLGGLLVFVGLIVVPIGYGIGWISPEDVNFYGYTLTFAICAIGLDLLWGFTGVLSLCQFVFFAIGAYCMGLYLVNHGPQIDGIPECLAYVMSDVQNPEPPWFLAWFQSFGGSVLLGIVLPGLAALVIGLTTFSSRVKGVYFAILTQAICVGVNLVFMKNDLNLGGTNGLTKFDTILGFPLAANDGGPFAQTRFWLYICSFLVLLAGIAVARYIARSGLGRVLVAARDDETRLRFNGYQIWAWKSIIFVIAAVLAALGGMLYAPQKGIINPHAMTAYSSILVVAWVAIGGRGTVWGAVIGAILVSLLYNSVTSSWPQGWMLLLGLLFILVPLLMPGGLLSLGILAWNRLKELMGLNKAVGMKAEVSQ